MASEHSLIDVVIWDINLFLESFTSWQHLRSYQIRYRLMAVCTHGRFIVLPSAS